jgi:hypothetical protein
MMRIIMQSLVLDQTKSITQTIQENFMEYCHKLASTIWKKPVEDRELYAGLNIGLTEEANGDDMRVFLLVKTYKQYYNGMGPCSHLQ